MHVRFATYAAIDIKHLVIIASIIEALSTQSMVCAEGLHPPIASPLPRVEPAGLDPKFFWRMLTKSRCKHLKNFMLWRNE